MPVPSDSAPTTARGPLSVALRTLAAGALLTLAACGEPGSTDEARILVASGFTDQVFVLDPGSGAVLDSLAVGRRPYARSEPHAMAVAPSGDRWYLTLAHGEPQLQVYERPGHRMIGALTLPMGGAARVGLTPDGAVAFVPDYGRSAGEEPGEVARIRTRTLVITHRTPICPAPHDARVDPSGELVLVTCAFGFEVVLLSASDLSERARIVVAEEPRGGMEGREAPRHAGPSEHPGASMHGADSVGPAGSRGAMPMPMNAAWSPDGSRAWVTLMGGDRIVEVGREGDVRRTVEAGPQPTSLLVTPDGRRLLVTNRQGPSLSIFSLPELELEREIDLGDAPHPQGITMGSEGGTAWVSYEGEVGSQGGVIALDLDSGQLRWQTVVGAYVLGIAWLPSLP